MNETLPDSAEPAVAKRPRRARQPLHPFRRAVLRGLGIVMPPLLTIVLFIWAWSMIDGYVLRPTEGILNFAIRQAIMRIEQGIPRDVPLHAVFITKDGQLMPLPQLIRTPIPRSQIPAQVEAHGARLAYFVHEDGTPFVPVGSGQFIPQPVLERVQQDPGELLLANATPEAIYRRYVELVYLPRWRVIPVFLVLFVGVLYFLGKFMALGAGRLAWKNLEGIIHRLPLVRNVYSSVKQVTDFVFSEQEVEFTRVVAVQYPRKGIWSVGFVTGESMADIYSAANEPVLTILIPTSPMPATGFTITTRKSETIDLDLSIDEAIQFIVSCGVVVPPHQIPPTAQGDAVPPLEAPAVEALLPSAETGNPSGTSDGVTESPSHHSDREETEDPDGDENT